MTVRCDHKHGNGARCGAPLTMHTDRIGRLLTSCPACTRRRDGRCRDCPRPVTGCRGRAIYCDGCRLARARGVHARWYQQDIAHAREIYRAVARRVRDRQRGGPPGDPARLAVARGLARAAALTPARRREIARHAVAVRWAKHRAAA